MQSREFLAFETLSPICSYFTRFTSINARFLGSGDSNNFVYVDNTCTSLIKLLSNFRYLAFDNSLLFLSASGLKMRISLDSRFKENSLTGHFRRKRQSKGYLCFLFAFGLLKFQKIK